MTMTLARLVAARDTLAEAALWAPVLDQLLPHSAPHVEALLRRALRLLSPRTRTPQRSAARAG